MPRLSRRAQRFQESAIRKLDAFMATRPGVRFHRVNIGQPDVPTPAAMLDAIHTWRPEVIAYGPSSGFSTTREAAAAYHRRWCPELEPRHVAITTGGSEALVFAFVAVCDPGDEVLVLEPFYTNYQSLSHITGIDVRAVQTHLADGFDIPADAVLDAACTGRTRAIVLTNPGNPTGAVYDRATVERVVRWAMDRGLYVIADEVYRRIWFDTPPASVLELDHAREHVIVIDSVSKTYSACGLRLGFFLCRSEAIMERVERFGQARLGPQPLAQVAAEAALALPESYYESLRLTYKHRMAAFVEALSAIPGVSTFRPAGAFYTMLELPVGDTEGFARFLARDFDLDGETVMVAPGGGFYTEAERGRHQVRVAAVLEEDRLRRVAEILAAALEAYPG